jgi:hypothetical protein
MNNLITRNYGQHYTTDFLSWTDGVDAMLKPSEDAMLPNVLVHTARFTNTPWGIAPGGMLLINPDMKEIPDFFGFICANEALGAYYGPAIFKGTPFEQAPVYKADITVNVEFPGNVSVKIAVAGHICELEMSDFDPAQYYNRAPFPMPFRQNVIEAKAKSATFKWDGRIIGGVLPATGIGAGLPACYSPAGMYIIE